MKSLAAPISSTTSAPSRLLDFYELTKPRMNFLVVITTMVGFVMASRGPVNWLLMLHTVVGTALTAASAAIFNQLIERDHDSKMPRTADRPVAAGRISLTEAATFGLTAGVAGVGYLALAVNFLTAILGLSTLLLYILVYTPLKRVTSLNTVVGAIPGAIPPLMGFTAVDNAISLPALSVFGILFFWQMPHFIAIAILYKRDYQLAGFKMLPCIDENQTLTSRMILLYAAALVPMSLLPAIIGMAGIFYYSAALLLGLAFFSFGVSCATTRTRNDARGLFFASIIYLPLLLGAMMFDKI
ncbi:MAG TPA: heme o synthase [Tepidisphaeraceae bacterium]|jgi:protoheme IX farnesyltransferase